MNEFTDFQQWALRVVYRAIAQLASRFDIVVPEDGLETWLNMGSLQFFPPRSSQAVEVFVEADFTQHMMLFELQCDSTVNRDIVCSVLVRDRTSVPFPRSRKSHQPDFLMSVTHCIGICSRPNTARYIHSRHS